MTAIDQVKPPKNALRIWEQTDPKVLDLLDFCPDPVIVAFEMAEERWISLLENAGDLISIVDREGNILFINRDIPGFTRDQLIGRSFFDFVNPEYWPRVRGSIASVFETGQTSKYEVKGPSTSGSPWWFVSRVGPVRQGDRVIAASVISTNITRQKEAEAALKKAHEELEEKVRQRTDALFKTNELLRQEIRERKSAEEELKIKTQTLEEMNAALKILLKQRDEDKKELEDKVLLNMRELAIPYLEKLKMSGLNKRQEAYAGVLESNLQDIISPLLYRMSFRHMNFTPSEIRIANLVKHGKTTKEIAELLSLSPRTIENHRKNIRRKLGLKGKPANLRAHLQSLQ